MLALSFNASGSRVNHGSATSLDDLAQGANGFSMLAWVYRVADGANQILYGKTGAGNVGPLFTVDNASGEGGVRLIIVRSTNTDFSSGAGLVPLNVWRCVACAFDDTLTPKVNLYTGSLLSPLVEVSYVLTDAGSGTPTTEAANDAWVGNAQLDATTLFFRGRIGGFAAFNRRLPLSELRRWQQELRRDEPRWRPGCVLLPDYSRSGTQRDRSPYGNHGTITTATPVEGVPRRAVNRRRRRGIAYLPPAPQDGPALRMRG